MANLVNLFTGLERDGFSVIVARGGAITPVLRALGVSSADAGLAEAEMFDLAAAVRAPRPSVRRGGGPGPRIYVPEIGLSLSGAQWRALAAVPQALAAVACARPCCRHGGAAALAQERAVEHSLVCRIEEATVIDDQPPTMRHDAALELVRDRRTACAG